MNTSDLPWVSHRIALIDGTAAAWILCCSERGLCAPIWGYVASAELSWWPSPDRSASSSFSSIRRSCLTCTVPATPGPGRCQQGSRTVSAASAGLLERDRELRPGVAAAAGLHGAERLRAPSAAMIRKPFRHAACNGETGVPADVSKLKSQFLSPPASAPKPAPRLAGAVAKRGLNLATEGCYHCDMTLL